jgi:hypothetical protein
MNTVRLLLVILLGTSAVPGAAQAKQQTSHAPQESGAQPSAQQASGPQWRRAEREDASRGRTLIQFTLRGKFLTAPGSETPNRPALLLSCVPDRHDQSEGKFSDAQVLVGAPLKIDYVEPLELTTGTSYLQKVTVQFRLNEAKASEKQWPAGADKASASIPKDAVKEILRAHAVVMTVKEKNAGEIQMQFDMSDPTQVEKACGMGSH